MSWKAAELGIVARTRRSFGNGRPVGPDPRAVAVEILSAELAQDGGPAPDVRCTVAQRSTGNTSPRVVGTSVCRQAWSPVWKETLRLELEPGNSNTRFFDLVLWDDSGGDGGEPSCLGELVIPLEDLLQGRGSVQVQSMPLLQGSESDARQVGTVFIRVRQVEEELAASRTSASKDPQTDVASRPSGDFSRLSLDTPRSSRQAVLIDVPADNPSGRTKSSPKAELGFFEASAPHIARSSRPHSLEDSSAFRVLPSDGPGPQVFDTQNARVFNMPAGRSTSVSPLHNEQGPSVQHLEPDSNAARVSPASSPPGIATKGASVLLMRGPPFGACVVGEQVGVGVGLQLATNGEFFVSSIVDGTPAAHAASTDMISIGDVVESIDGVRCRGQPVDYVIAMMKGAEHTPVHLDLRRKESALRPDSGSRSILVICLRESFHKLLPQEDTFSAVLIQDLTACSGSYSNRFKYMGMEDHRDQIEASIEVTEEIRGIDERSSRQICDDLVAQTSNAFSKLRQSPSMENFRGIKHYLKAGNKAQMMGTPAHTVLTSMSKLDAAMESVKASNSLRPSKMNGDPLSVKASNSLRPSQVNGDPLSNYPDVEMSLRSIGNPASTLRLNSTAILQSTETLETDGTGIKSPRDLHVSIRDGHNELQYSAETPKRLNRSTRLDQTVYGTQFDMRHIYFRFAALIVSIIAMALLLGSRANPVPWHWLGWISILFAGIAPWAQYFHQYFAGGGGSPVQWVSDLVLWQTRPYNGDVPFWWLSLSTFVSATLGDAMWESSAFGFQYGSVGGFAHSIYYIGIAIMFAIIYRLRTLHPHAQSLMQLVNVCFGYEACGLFGGLVLYRILSLVWTGALTTGLLLAEFDSSMGSFWASLLCGVAPMFYTLMGGTRSLYAAHPLQALLLLIFVLVTVCQIPAQPNWIKGQGSWKLTGGGDLIIVRLLQGSLSLPWVTAVLTDRAFLGSPVAGLSAVLAGTFLAYSFSFMSSVFGVYARSAGISGSIVDVGKNLGQPYYHLVVLMTIINSMGIIDSCFVSAAKLGGLEAFGLLADRRPGDTCTHPLGIRSARISRTNVLVGRITLMMVGGVGLCCLAVEVYRPGSILLARLSGIMTMGISPPMILMCAWKRNWKRSPTAFWMSIVVSIIIGILFSLSTACTLWVNGQCAQRTVTFTSKWKLGEGDFGHELGLTVFSFLIAILGCMTGFLLDQQFRLADSPDEPNKVYRYAETLANKEVDCDFH